MKSYDVVVIGAGRVGTQIASDLYAKKLNIAVVALPPATRLREASDAHLHRLLSSFESDHPVPALESGPLAYVDYLTGAAQFDSNHKLRVGAEALTAKKFVLATGSVPFIPRIQGLAESEFLLPLDALHQSRESESIVIIGAGSLGVALADRLAKKGGQVTLVANRNQILPHEEPEIALALRHQLESLTVRVVTEADVRQVRQSEPGQLSVMFEQGGQRHEVSADRLVIAAGMIPQTQGIGLDRAGVYLAENETVVVNEDMRTSAPNIWAAGSVTGAGSLLLEEYQGRLCAANLNAPFFARTKFSDEPLPFNIPLNPPFARIGLTEAGARATRKHVKTALSRLDVNRRAELQQQTDGLIKLVGNKKNGELLGAHVWAPHAEEIILTFNLAMKAGISLYDLAEQHYYLPITFGEAIYSAIRDWTQAS